MSEFWQIFLERRLQLLAALLQHVNISLIALIIAVGIAVPLGVWLSKSPRYAESLIGSSAIMQTIPSLALLGLLIPLVGIGKTPAIIALVIYALLPILRNTYTGIREVEPSLVEAARGMGMDPLRSLIKVELPLAMPVIIAGIRTAMVLIVGTATLAALIGAGGLGDLILLGIDRNNHLLILLGAIPAAALAIFFDVILRKLSQLSFRRAFYILTSMVLIVVISILYTHILNKNRYDLVIAGKLGAEPEILINIYQQLIEDRSTLRVELKPGFGKTSFIFSALLSGDIDIYPEFTGTILSTFLNQQAVSHNRIQVYQQARQGIAEHYNLQLLSPMGYNNTYALAVSPSVAERYQLSRLSDLKPLAHQLRAGFTLEFIDRQDGYKGIQQQYGTTFGHVINMEPKLRYAAIQSQEIDIIDAYSTDSELTQYSLRVLIDDRMMFPPYQAAPLMRSDTLMRYPQLEAIFSLLKDKITDEQMRQMNYQINVEGTSAQVIANRFLCAENLLKNPSACRD